MKSKNSNNINWKNVKKEMQLCSNCIKQETTRKPKPMQLCRNWRKPKAPKLESLTHQQQICAAIADYAETRNQKNTQQQQRIWQKHIKPKGAIGAETKQWETERTVAAGNNSITEIKLKQQELNAILIERRKRTHMNSVKIENPWLVPLLCPRWTTKNSSFLHSIFSRTLDASLEDFLSN